MHTQSAHSSGVLLSRFDRNIQYFSRAFLQTHWGAERIDLMTAEDPLHLFFHDIDTAALTQLRAHMDAFLEGARPQRLALAAGPRCDVLTDEEVKRKICRAVNHLATYFPTVEITGLFIDPQTRSVEPMICRGGESC